MAKVRQRSLQQQAEDEAASDAAAEPAVDPVKAAKAKTLVLQATVLVAAAVALACFKVISDKVAMGVIVLMYVTLRLFT